MAATTVYQYSKGFLFLGLLSSQPLQARIEKALPTVSLITEFAQPTQKSKTVLQNDVGTFFSYNLQINAGIEKNIGVQIRNDTQTVAFELNSSSIQTIWQDALLRYAFVFEESYLSLGLIIGSMEGEVKRGEPEAGQEEELSFRGKGYGGAGEFVTTLGNWGFWSTEARMVSIAGIQEANQVAVTMGGRTDITTTLHFHLTRSALNFLWGYRMRNYSINDGTAQAEAISMPIFGLQFNTSL